MDEYLTNNGFEFQTLTVSGRGKAAYTVDAQQVAGRDGALFRDSTLEPRSIVVRAKVSANSNESYRQGMSDLLGLAHERKVHEIKFTDDEGYSFYGVFQRIEDEDETSNKQIVEIELVCHDPFKYQDEQSTSTTNGDRISIDSVFRVVPEEIEIEFDGSTDAQDFTINNTTTGLRIRYEQEGSASGDTIRIRQKDDYIGYLDSTNHIDGLNVLYSHFDEFTVFDGDQLVVTPEPLSINITYKGASL